MLELKNITKDYEVGDDKVHALKGVSLAFRENEMVSILGQSGCGKTTLLNIIGGLDRYTDGDLIINVARPSILKHPTGTRTATKNSSFFSRTILSRT